MKIVFEIAEHTDQYIDDLDFDNEVKIKPYLVVNHSVYELPKMLYANELISTEPITIQFDFGNKTHIKQFLHPPFTRRHLARVICSELKHIYGIHQPGWSFTQEMRLENVILKDNIYMVNYYLI